ncbi:MAG: hypothetical protein LBK99_16050 [Opitutaceae bacterium]|jgi:predicted DNA-binding transcriptional regulator YafY|nr:hypothetical protein [Opitutaceae bacterium]
MLPTGSLPSPIPARSGDPSCIARIRRLHDYLSAGRAFTAESFAREWEGISARTIKRDIEHLRNAHNAPVEWDPARRTYCYARPYTSLQLTPLPRIDADEALALILAGRTFAAWRGSTLDPRPSHSLRSSHGRHSQTLPKIICPADNKSFIP